AVFENTGASVSNDNAQAVTLRAPQNLGTQGPVALLNNVVTESSEFYFLQVGFYFDNGEGDLVYTSSQYNLYPQYYDNMPFVGTHDYSTSITFTTGHWQLCAYDTDVIAGYQCIIDADSSVGTTLKADLNTAIFA